MLQLVVLACVVLWRKLNSFLGLTKIWKSFVSIPQILQLEDNCREIALVRSSEQMSEKLNSSDKSCPTVFYLSSFRDSISRHRSLLLLPVLRIPQKHLLEKQVATCLAAAA